jgi:hypothetical protein
MREREKNIWLENLKGRDHLLDIGIDGRIILEWILLRLWESANWKQ